MKPGLANPFGGILSKLKSPSLHFQPPSTRRRPTVFQPASFSRFQHALILIPQTLLHQSSPDNLSKPRVSVRRASHPPRLNLRALAPKASGPYRRKTPIQEAQPRGPRPSNPWLLRCLLSPTAPRLRRRRVIPPYRQPSVSTTPSPVLWHLPRAASRKPLQTTRSATSSLQALLRQPVLPTLSVDCCRKATTQSPTLPSRNPTTFSANLGHLPAPPRSHPPMVHSPAIKR